MATVRIIATRALRLIGIVPAGDSASAEDGATALEALQSLFDHTAATEGFGALTTVLETGTYEAGENERVIGATSVTLPDTITDDCGVERAPKDRSVVIVAGDTPATHLYDIDLASWIAIRSLTLNSECPLSGRFSRGLSAMLAVELAPEYAATVSDQVAQMAQQGRSAIRRHDPIRAANVDSALLRANPGCY